MGECRAEFLLQLDMVARACNNNAEEAETGILGVGWPTGIPESVSPNEVPIH